MGNYLRAAGLAFLAVFAFGNFAQAEEINADSAISAVSIYPGHALVSRTARVSLSQGPHKVIFPDIVPEINDNSVRVTAKGTAQAKLFGAQVKREYLTASPSEKIKQLESQIEEAGDQVKKLNGLAALIREEKDFLDSLRLFSKGELPKELVTKMPAVVDLESTLKFLDVKLRDNYDQRLDIELKLRELGKKLEALRNELGQITRPTQRLKRSIIVELEVSRSGDLDLDISYLVPGADWQPIYDARADFEKSEVELVSYGLVKQSTGDDWQDAAISLSTANPAVGGSMPYVAPWFLKPYQPPMARQASFDMAKGTLAGSVSESYSAQTEAFESKENELASLPIKLKAKNAYAQAQEKGTSVIYKLSRKESIKSDGSEHKLPISAQVLKASFEYSSYPRLSPFAYLGSRVTNDKDLQLLSGGVNVFLDGDFVGSSSIENIAPQEEFDLYLGVDENVKVKREQVSKKVDDVLIAGIPAPNRKTTFKYKLSVENYKTKKARVILFEAMPVSQDERIKVKVNNPSLEPKEKDWKDRKGIWRWELELDPKAKQEIFYTYTVEHPRDMMVEGL